MLEYPFLAGYLFDPANGTVVDVGPSMAEMPLVYREFLAGRLDVVCFESFGNVLYLEPEDIAPHSTLPDVWWLAGFLPGDSDAVAVLWAPDRRELCSLQYEHQLTDDPDWV